MSRRWCLSLLARAVLYSYAASIPCLAQDISWISQSGTSAQDEARSVVVNSTGVYVAGYTDGALPGQSNYGYFDAYVCKFDADKHELWSRQFGTTGDDHAVAVAADSSALYVAGDTYGTLPGQTAYGSADAYVRKYDLDGNELWTRQFGTSGWYGDGIYAIAIDSTGIYIAGVTDGAFPEQTNYGGTDAYVRKYDADGQELWTRQFGTSGSDEARGIAIDPTGVYVAYSMNGDTYVRKYDADGQELWSHQFGTPGEQVVTDIAADTTGIYVVGSTLDAFPGQTNSGGLDAYVIKFSSDGQQLWARQFGTEADDRGSAIDVNPAGVFVTGETSRALPGQTLFGSWDIYVRKYDVDGDELWTKQFGTSGPDVPYDIAVDLINAYVVGSTEGSFADYLNLGSSDSFLAKLRPANPYDSRIWPMDGHDPQLTGRSPYAGPTVAGPAWTFSSGSAIATSPVVSSEGVIYFGSDKFYALRPDGTVFAEPVSGSIATTAAIDDASGYVYVGTGGYDSWSFLRMDKNLQNVTTVLAGSHSALGNPIVASNGTVYLAAGAAFAFGPHTWVNSTSCWQSYDFTPAVGLDGSVYFTCREAYWSGRPGVHRLDGKTGAEMQTSYVERSGPGPVVDSQGNLYDGQMGFNGATYFGNVIKFDKALSAVWTTGEFTTSRMALLPGDLPVNHGYFEIGVRNPANGARVWNFALPDERGSSPPAVDRDGRIYFGTSSGKFYCLDPGGDLLWSYQTGGAITAQAAIDNAGHVYVGSSDGKLYAFGSPVGPPPTPNLVVTPTALSFSYEAGRLETVPAKALHVSSSGAALDFAASVSTTTGGSWLSVTPTSGTTPVELYVGVSPSLYPGTYQGTITINSSDASNSPQTVPVTLSVTYAPATLLGLPGNEKQTGFTNEPINTATGNYYSSHTDVAGPGRGLALRFARYYNSQDTYSGPLGAGWTHSYNMLLTVDAVTGQVTVKEGDGHEVYFSPAGVGDYVPVTRGLFDTLRMNSDGSFVLTRKNQTRLYFGSTGRLFAVTDRNGNAQALSYDGGGRLTTLTDSAGRSCSFEYDAGNRLISLTDPIGRLLQYSYDAAGNLASFIDAAGAAIQYSYDAHHRMVSATDARGVVFLRNVYDAQGRVTSQTNARGFTTTLAYDAPSTGTTTITDPLGNITKHIHDSGLRLVAVTDALEGTITYAYDADNNRTSVTDQNGHQIKYAYDSRGNITKITDPLNNAVRLTYDSKNSLLSVTNTKGIITGFSYDDSGNLTCIANALGNQTQFTYDSFGEVDSKIDARGNQSTYVYDSFGNLVQITDPLGNTTSIAYDGIGRLVSISDANNHTATATYDALGRLLAISDPLGNQMQFAYDPVGNLTQIIDPNGHATAYAYDAASNLVTVTDALGNVTRYAYDEDNNRIRFTNAKGNATSYIYDALHRLVQITNPLGFPTFYDYDAVGNVTAVLDANGKTNRFIYDALDRLISIQYADDKEVTYVYDVNGNRTSMVDPEGTTTYDYDVLDRLASVAHPGGQLVMYSYDEAGNRRSLTYPEGKIVIYDYDPLNRLSQVTDWLGRATTYDYDAAGNLSKKSYPNGASVGFNYDAANRLTRIDNSYRGSASVPANPVTSFTYVLDGVGNRLQVTDGSGVATVYTYDASDQLVSVMRDAKVTRFTYDAVGNRLNLTEPSNAVVYSYDDADRLLSAGRTAFLYDDNGNQVAKIVGKKTTDFSYDAANRLVAVKGPHTNSEFAYDGDGNRIRQSVAGGTYEYINDVGTALPVVLHESGPDGNITYTYGLGQISSSGPSFEFFNLFDGLDSVVGLTEADGNLSGRYVYDAWGQSVLAVRDPQIGTRNKYRFTGEALDPETGLYYLRARYYDPEISRFIGQDPFDGHTKLPLSKQTYLYALNNPVVNRDPDGRDPLSPQPLVLGVSTTGSRWENLKGGIKQFAKTATCAFLHGFCSAVDLIQVEAENASRTPQIDREQIINDAIDRIDLGLSTRDAYVGATDPYSSLLIKSNLQGQLRPVIEKYARHEISADEARRLFLRR